jgi:hypothetical protein
MAVLLLALLFVEKKERMQLWIFAKQLQPAERLRQCRYNVPGMCLRGVYKKLFRGKGFSGHNDGF